MNSHIFSLCKFCSRYVTICPQSQVIRRIGHTSEWANSSPRLICCAQRVHFISISLQVFTCSVTPSKFNCELHARHSHLTFASNLLAKMLRQNIATGWRHIAHDVFEDFFNVSVQNPQKVCPQGVAISASRTTLLLFELK